MVRDTDSDDSAARSRIRPPFQFVKRERAHAAALNARHQIFELAPAFLASFAETRGS